MEWGVHVLRPVSEADVVLLAQGGLNRVTVHLPWRWIEQVRGRLDFESVEHFTRPLLDAGISLQGALGPGMPHLLPDWLLEQGGVDAEGYVDLFADYCAATAAHMDAIQVFRVEEELNAAFVWEGLRTRRRRGRSWRNASFRAGLLVRAAAAVRSARPDAELRATVHGGMPGWKNELERWLNGGLAVDRIGVSLFPCGLLPHPALASRVGRVVAAARDVVDRTGAALPVEVSRVAYPTHHRAWSPRLQREFLVRAAHSAEAAGAVGFHWWALRDQAYDDPMLHYWTPGTQRHMGLMYYDGAPKPSLDEYRVVATGDRFGEGRSG